jgi:hypothetical protein
MMNFDPLDEYEEAEQFKKDLRQVGENFRFQEPSWHPTKVDAFKAATKLEICRSVLFEHVTEFEVKKNVRGENVLKIVVRTKDWGQLTVPVPLDYLLSDQCPAELPSHLAAGFKKKFESKRKKLIQDLRKNGDV